MSHYDCRECGAGPLEDCECRKTRTAARLAYWAEEARKRREAVELVRSFQDTIPGLSAPFTDALSTVLQLASRGVAEAERFAAADH